MKERVGDPEMAELLTPDVGEYPLFAKRPPLDHEYMEAFNRDNVQLVDIKNREPIVEITKTGLRTTKNEFEFDIIVLATGFRAYTGALEAFPIRDASGQTLAEDDWSAHVSEVHAQTLMAQGGKVDSWMMGANIEDHNPRVLIYFGGAHVYYDRLDESAAAGFPELEFTKLAS